MTWQAIRDWLRGKRAGVSTKRDTTFDHEAKALHMDIDQIERVNMWLLDKAVARERITPELAAMLRATHVDDSSSPPESRDSSGSDPSTPG